MPWVRIEDSFYDHPKVLETPIAAIGLHIVALCYCSAHLTDGYLGPGPLRYLHGTPKLAAALVKVGLWEESGDGWQIHDFLDYNPSKAETVEKRRHISQERSKAGSNGAAKRWQTDSNAIAPSRTSRNTRPVVISHRKEPPTLDEQKQSIDEQKATLQGKLMQRLGVTS